MNLNNLSIRARLLAVMLWALLLMSVGTAIALWSARQTATATELQVAVTAAVRAQMQADMMHDAVRGDILEMTKPAVDAAVVRQARADLAEHLATMGKALATLNEGAHGSALDPVVGAATVVAESYAKSARAVAAAESESARQAALAAYEVAFKETEARLATLGDALQHQAAVHAEDVRVLSRTVMFTLLAGGTLGAGLLMALTAAVAVSIGRAVKALQQAADDLQSGDGDLTRRLPAFGGEFGALAHAFNGFIGKLDHTLQQVRGSADSISVSSREIAQGNQDLSSRTEQQASSLQQTAASLEQMTGTVKQNADTAKQASQLASGASEVAARGGSMVGEVVVRMGEIQKSSRKIAEIIGVIDGIAFQTNILALNAAVEAARAGEQGRGFAVVAGEVRNLAQRSAQAAREIKSLISDSVEKVDSGSKLVNDAGQTMSDIVAQVKRVTDLIEEITSATLEQSGGIGQVNQAVGQLDQMTQQNAALVEQSAAAAESLKEQAGRLAQAVAVFRLTATAA
jgi:methyl-accepting chemotaxis protein